MARSSYTARPGLKQFPPFKGMRREGDPGSLPDHKLWTAENVRFGRRGMPKNRGGQAKVGAAITGEVMGVFAEEHRLPDDPSDPFFLPENLDGNLPTTPGPWLMGVHNDVDFGQTRYIAAFDVTGGQQYNVSGGGWPGSDANQHTTGFITMFRGWIIGGYHGKTDVHDHINRIVIGILRFVSISPTHISFDFSGAGISEYPALVDINYTLTHPEELGGPVPDIGELPYGVAVLDDRYIFVPVGMFNWGYTTVGHPDYGVPRRVHVWKYDAANGVVVQEENIPVKFDFNGGITIATIGDEVHMLISAAGWYPGITPTNVMGMRRVNGVWSVASFPSGFLPTEATPFRTIRARHTPAEFLGALYWPCSGLRDSETDPEKAYILMSTSGSGGSFSEVRRIGTSHRVGACASFGDALYYTHHADTDTVYIGKYDGITWNDTHVTFSGLTPRVHPGLLFVAYGKLWWSYQGAFKYTTDGTNWTNASYSGGRVMVGGGPGMGPVS